METLKEKDLQEEIRSALSREGALEKREQRELRKAEATGRVTSFLKNRANSDETLRASLALVEARTPVEIAQATIQYQQFLGTQGRQSSEKIQQNVPSPNNPLPPLPDDNKIYVLTVQNTELKWIETQDC